MTIRGPAGNIQHSSAGWEDYTDPKFVGAGRETLLRIDLDPASCELANSVVQADTFWTVSDDGLRQPEWGDYETRVFLNPPGGKCTFGGVPLPRDAAGKQNGPGESYAAHWWEKLVTEYEIGRVDSAIFVCFSLNLFQNGQSLGPAHAPRRLPAAYRFPFVVPEQRPRYWSPTRAVGSGAPSQPGAIVYLPERETNGEPAPAALARFVKAFGVFGEVRV